MSKADQFKSLVGGRDTGSGKGLERTLNDIAPAKKNNNHEVKRTTLRFDADFHRKFKMYAAGKDRFMDDIAQEAIEEYMKNNP